MSDFSNELFGDIEQLTRSHKKSVYTDEGYEVHERDSLLEQLRQAVFGGMEKTGGSGSKARLPISEAASDLYTLIDNQIAQAWSAWAGRVPSTTRPEALLAEWASGIGPDAIIVVTHPEQHERWDETKGRDVPRVIHVKEEHTPATLASQWVAAITDFLNPQSTAGIKAPCIQCGVAKVPRVRDGEHVLTDALVFRRDRDTGRTLDARCLSCGATWPPTKFDFLAESIGISVAEVRAKLVAQ